MVMVHINNTKHSTIANIYIPPRDTTSTHYKTADTDIQHCIQYITNIPHSVFTSDVNAHSTLWHSYTDDHRGQLIADVISNSDHITLNTNTPTRVPNTTLYRLQQNRWTVTNYKKADWTQFTEYTESAFSQTTIPANIHTANWIFTNIILMAVKHNIPKGKMHSNCRLLSEDIVCTITQWNNIRRDNTCDPALKLLNEEITSDIQKHKQNIWKEHLRRWFGSQAQHTQSLEDHTWSIQQSNTTHTKHIHNIQQQNGNSTQTHCELFDQTINKNCQTHKTNRHINRATHNIQGHNITLTTSQVQEAIKQIKITIHKVLTN